MGRWSTESGEWHLGSIEKAERKSREIQEIVKDNKERGVEQEKSEKTKPPGKG